jgi:restriction system protein
VEGDELERMIREVQWQPSTRENPPAQQAETTQVDCPRCHSPMIRRTARRGNMAGQDFWGCSTYPRCRGTRDIPQR